MDHVSRRYYSSNILYPENAAQTADKIFAAQRSFLAGAAAAEAIAAPCLVQSLRAGCQVQEFRVVTNYSKV